MDQSFIKPLSIHKEFGVKDIDGVRVLNIKRSNKAKSKYTIIIYYKGKTRAINFGHIDYQQYRDRSPLKLFKYLNHLDENRRLDYLARASKIINKKGLLTCNDPFSPNRYAIIVLW